MNALELKNVSKKYEDFALDGISFSLPQGAVLGLVGANGAGKSTTLKMIMEGEQMDGGSITVLGTDNKSRDFGELKEDIGVVLDEAYFPDVLNAKQVDHVMKHTYKSWDSEKYQGYIKKFSLPLPKPFKDYSRGMRMKLAIAVALSHDPKLLILDEATSGLDPIARDEILDIFNEFTRDEQHTIVLSSHIVSDLEKICDYIAFIHDGTLVFFDEKDALLEKYGMVHTSAEKAQDIADEAIIGKKVGKYGVELMVRKDKLSCGKASKGYEVERTNIEEIILFLVKGGIQ